MTTPTPPPTPPAGEGPYTIERDTDTCYYVVYPSGYKAIFLTYIKAEIEASKLNMVHRTATATMQAEVARLTAQLAAAKEALRINLISARGYVELQRAKKPPGPFEQAERDVKIGEAVLGHHALDNSHRTTPGATP